jgi:hypothetical protein
VKYSAQESTEIVGNGDVIMECVLTNRLVSSFHVCTVLHVPRLGHTVISWRKLRTNGYSEFGEGDYISINKEKKVFFEAVFDRNLFKIPEISHSAYITYTFWHQALGHVAPSSMDKAVQLYSNANIPAEPTDFLCDSCVRSTMIRGSGQSKSRKDSNRQDVVHSDWSGPFPVSSYCNSLYYIILINHATRVAWVRFMKQKSELPKLLRILLQKSNFNTTKLQRDFERIIMGSMLPRA